MSLTATQSATDRAPRLKGLTKSAVLLVSLGVESASTVMKCLDAHEVERISMAIAELRSIPSDHVRQVLEEYRQMGGKHRLGSRGGADFARQALSSALGDDRAEELLNKVDESAQKSAFHLLNRVENSQLAGFLQSEHPQTAALILSHVSARKSSEVISLLPNEQQQEVVYRLATMGKTSPALVEEIESVLREQVGSVLGTELSTSGGVELVAEILNFSNRSTERAIMDALVDRDPNLAGGIKALMFTFDDLVGVEGRDLQRLLTEIDQKDLVLSLKGCAPELKDKLMGNVSERAAAAIQEELELLGPVKMTEIEEAQRRIIEVAQDLEEREEISLARGGEEQMVM